MGHGDASEVDMPDHFFDELDRDEINLWDTNESDPIRNALRQWLGYAPSPFQITVAEQKVEQMRGLAGSVGMRIMTSRVREGVSIVERTVLRDARGRFVARGAERVMDYLNKEVGF